MGALRRCHRPFFNTTVALLVVWPLLLSTTTRSGAHPASSGLPTLRLDYYAYGPNGKWLLDPAWAGCNPNCGVGPVQLLPLVQANLVKLLPNGKPVHDLATWKISKNRLVYTFTIRKSARFANGHPVTAQDAAFSLRRSLAPGIGFSTIWANLPFLIQGGGAYQQGKAKTLPGITVLDQRTLRITLTKPVAYFLVLLSFPSLDVLDRTEMAGKSTSVNPKENYLTKTCTANQGAGPFTFVCHDRSSNPHSFYAGGTPKYTLVPNPYYYGPKPHLRIELPRILLKPNDVSEEYKRYLAKKIDVSRIPPVFLRRWVGKSSQYHAFSAPLINYLVPNVHLAPFDNVHCRLALAYAIDRKVLASKVGNGTAIPGYTVVPKGLLGSYDGKDNPHYSLKQARAELAKCPGRTTPVEYKYLEGRVEEAAVGAMLRAAGLNVMDEPLSGADLNRVVSRPLDRTNTQLVTSGWEADYPDPEDFCGPLLGSHAFGNIGGWQNAAYDRLVDRADVTVSPKERAKLYIQAQHIALGEGAMISETQGLTPFLIRSTVHGLVGGPAYPLPTAKDLDWANVSLSTH